MIESLNSWLAFLAELYKSTPALHIAVVTYPVGCALGIYWTQGIKRSQRRRKWGDRENLTSFELRGVSSCIAGVVISLMAIAFYRTDPPQTLVHAILGGSLAPLLMWAFIGVLGALASVFPSVAAFRESVKTGDRRKRELAPPDGVERRSLDDTTEFYKN